MPRDVDLVPAEQEARMPGILLPDMVMDFAHIKRRMEELQAFVRDYMVPGEDYGVIPGTDKPTLKKPGAEKLCDVYGLQRLFEIVERVEDWDRPLFHYVVRADLIHAASGKLIAQGLGAANSMEDRYRWRWVWANEIPPHLSREGLVWKTVNTKRGEAKKYRIPNDDPYTLVNTLIKMAKKRALVDAVLSATRSSGIFTQDLEDLADAGMDEDEEERPTRHQPAPRQPQGRYGNGNRRASAQGAPAQENGTGNGQPPAQAADPLAQLRREIIAFARQVLGYSDEQIRFVARSAAGREITSLKDLTEDELRTLDGMLRDAASPQE